MTIRPLRPEDAGGLLAMWNAAARFDPLTAELLDEKTRGDGGFDPELALVATRGAAITGFVMGVLRPQPGVPKGFLKLIAVARDHRRSGIGSRLIETVENTLRDRGAGSVRVCESAPNYLVPGVDTRYASAPHFFQRHGYRRTGEACNMTVDLDRCRLDQRAGEKSLAGRGITLRRAAAPDRDRLLALLETHWPAWIDEVEVSLQNRPPSLHIAESGGSLAGFAAWDANNRGTGWFGPMGTAPRARGQGIGRFLLLRCLADIRATGLREAIIPWVGPVGFYEASAGATVTRTFHRYEKVLAP